MREPIQRAIDLIDSSSKNLGLALRDTPLDSPKVYADGNPYRDFAPLYASLGLRVARDGSADKLELNV